MHIGVLFWMLMILALLFNAWVDWPNHSRLGGTLLLWVLLALLGLHCWAGMTLGVS